MTPPSLLAAGVIQMSFGKRISDFRLASYGNFFLKNGLELILFLTPVKTTFFAWARLTETLTNAMTELSARPYIFCGFFKHATS